MTARSVIMVVWGMVLYALYQIGYLHFFPYAVCVLCLLEITWRYPWNRWNKIALVHILGIVFINIFSATEIVFIASIVMINDSFAYLGGRFANFLPFMRRRIFPTVSPKKTLGGLLYGLIAAMISAVLLGRMGNIGLIPALSAGLLVAFLSVAGDAVESKFKRVHGIKDSGDGLFTRWLFWGHGGCYDRFDALALTCWGWLIIRTLVFAPM
jgi:CDP-diglyceride synthetase